MTPRWFQITAATIGVGLAFFFFFARLGSWQNHRVEEIDEAEQALCEFVSASTSIDEVHDQARDAVRAASAEPYAVFLFGVVESLAGERTDFDEETELRTALTSGAFDVLNDTIDELDRADALVARRSELWRTLSDRLERQARHDCQWSARSLDD